MSQDPDRLLSAFSDADELERELLASVRDAAPPRGARSEVWRGLATQIAAVTLASAAHASTLGAATSGAGAASSATSAAVQTAAVHAGAKAGAFTLSKAFATKLVFGLALGAAAVGAGSAWIAAREAPPRPMQTGAAVLADRAASSHAFRVPAPEPAPSPASSPMAMLPAETARAAPSGEPREPKDDERLRAESQLLAKARAELRKGNSGAARATLQRLQARFPKGVLRQEREVLAIEILSAQGKSAASEQRARAFIKAHPESPHSTNLRRFTEAP